MSGQRARVPVARRCSQCARPAGVLVNGRCAACWKADGKAPIWVRAWIDDQAARVAPDLVLAPADDGYLGDGDG